MGKSSENKRLSFEKVFAQSIADAREGKLAIAMPIVRHPSHRHIEMLAPKNGVKMGGLNVFADWMGEDLPWMGAAVWAMPANLEKEMINNARCGALFSHGSTDSEKDRAYIEHLGPVGSQVSGTQWNPSAFEGDKFPLKVCVGLVDVSIGREDRSRMAGRERPDYWQEPLPMIKRVWSQDDPPSKAPDFGAVAEILAQQMRASVAEAILEETDATQEQLDELLGGVMRLPNKAAQHFARQEHPMFGASKLGGAEREEAMQAMDCARVAFEQGAMERSTPAGTAPKHEGPRL